MASAARPLPQWLTVSTGPAPAVVDGRACRTRAAFFEEVARALRLPAISAATGTRSPTPYAIRPGAGRHPDRGARRGTARAEPPEQFAILLAVLAGAAEAGLTVTLCTDPGHEAPLRLRAATALA